MELLGDYETESSHASETASEGNGEGPCRKRSQATEVNAGISDNEMDKDCDWYKLAVTCRPRDVSDAVKKLKAEDLEVVKSLGFDAFLELTVETTCKPQAIDWMMRRAVNENDHIAIPIKPGFTLYITEEEIYQLTEVPRSGDRTLNFKGKQKEAWIQLKNELGLEEKTTVDKVLDKMGKCTGQNDRVKCFFLILISKVLLPSTSKDINTEAVLYTSDMSNIGNFNWCNIIYEHLRDAIQQWQEKLLDKRVATGKPTNAMSGYVILLLIYLVDNMLMKKKKKKKKAPKFYSKTCPRINQYTCKLVNEMVTAAKRQHGGRIAFDNFELKPREHMCYAVTSRTEMDCSLQFVSQGSTDHTGGAVAVGPDVARCLKKAKQVLLKSKNLLN